MAQPQPRSQGTSPSLCQPLRVPKLLTLCPGGAAAVLTGREQMRRGKACPPNRWARTDVTWWGGPQPVPTSGLNPHRHLSRLGDEIPGEGVKMREQTMLCHFAHLFFCCRGCCEVQAWSPSKAAGAHKACEQAELRSCS